jgi:hypothetical protein
LSPPWNAQGSRRQTIQNKWALSDAELRFRPFEALEFVEPSPLAIAQGVINEMDAHAALQSDLALNGVGRMTPNTAETLLARFGVRGEAARAILIELWQHAYKKLLFRDDQVDSGEREYLQKLQTARLERRKARARNDRSRTCRTSKGCTLGVAAGSLSTID